MFFSRSAPDKVLNKLMLTKMWIITFLVNSSENENFFKLSNWNGEHKCCGSYLDHDCVQEELGVVDETKVLVKHKWHYVSSLLYALKSQKEGFQRGTLNALPRIKWRYGRKVARTAITIIIVIVSYREKLCKANKRLSTISGKRR